MGLVILALAVSATAAVGWLTWRVTRQARKRALQAGAALRASEEKFGRAFADAPIGMAIVGLDGYFHQVNTSLCEITGRDEPDLLVATFQEITHPEDLDADLALVEDVLAGRRRTYRMEKRYLRPDGSVVWVLLGVSLVRDELDEPLYFVSQVEDITARKAMEHELKGQRRDLMAIGELARDVAIMAKPHQRICEAVCSIMRTDFAVLFEPTDKVLELTAAHGTSLPGGASVAIGDEPSGAVIALLSGERLFVSDAGEHPGVSNRLVKATGVRSIVFEPILRHGHVEGVLAVGWRREHVELSDRESSVLRLVASEAAVAIERASLLSRLEQMARTDALSGLPNRRVWDESLPNEVARARRLLLPLSVAILDLDHFKVYNDELGHQAGDRLIKETGVAWSAQLRQTDVLARIGGDEFALLLPDCDADSARNLLERLLGTTPGSQLCSAGCATLEDGEDADAFMRRADLALYEAKHAGHGGVEAA